MVLPVFGLSTGEEARELLGEEAAELLIESGGGSTWAAGSRHSLAGFMCVTLD